MGMIKRAIGFNAPEKVSRSLFTALVRSDVEYGSSLWSGTDLTFFLKCKLELCDLNLNNFVVFNSTLQNRPTTRSSADPLLLIPKRCKTESHRASFFNRIVPLWNQLPLTVRSTVNMASFKSQLSEWYQNKFQESFNTDNVCSWVTCCQCCDCRQV